MSQILNQVFFIILPMKYSYNCSSLESPMKAKLLYLPQKAKYLKHLLASVFEYLCNIQPYGCHSWSPLYLPDDSNHVQESGPVKTNQPYSSWPLCHFNASLLTEAEINKLRIYLKKNNLVLLLIHHSLFKLEYHSTDFHFFV